jgi:hypothetical protein
MIRRDFLRSLIAAPAAGLVRVPLVWTPEACAQQAGGMALPEPFTPSEGANHPVGEGKGIHPGRVVWTRDSSVATWDGVTGHWWDDAYTNQKVVHDMISRLLRDLTGRKHDKQAWDALFRSFNETHQGGRSGYRPGERIAIKVNCNQERSPLSGIGASRPPGAPQGARPPRGPQNGLPSPHVVAALVTQLIEIAGVRGHDILIYDASRNVGQPIFGRIRANSHPQFQAVQFLVGHDYGEGGRMLPTPDLANPVRFAKAELPAGFLPQQVTEAKYLINLGLMRPHNLAGATLTGKNLFGSIHFPNDGGWTPRVLHSTVARTVPMGSYNALVDLVGHRHLGGKTMLYMLDGLYTSEHQGGNVFKWASFGDQWAASLLMSQDPVALDSVGLDILRSEPRATQVRGNPDNYLHEAALAAKPPSGSVYHPDGRGPLASLGVHEHWNNPTARQYSRNLGRKQGIELIAAV